MIFLTLTKMESGPGNNMDAQVLNFFTVFFSRMGAWFLTGPSLVEFCCNRRIDKNSVIYIGVIGVPQTTIEERCRTYNLSFEAIDGAILTSIKDFAVRFIFYKDGRKGWLEAQANKKGKIPAHSLHKSWVSCDDGTAQEIRKKSPYMAGNGFWKVQCSQIAAIDFPLPYKAGHVIDAWGPWLPDLQHAPVDWFIGDVFMNEERKVNGLELLKQLYECGERAGIAEFMFVGFGTALGIARHGDFVPNDRDMDMCINADLITPEQGQRYVEECKKAGLGEHRWRVPQVRDDDNMPLWFSLGPKDPVVQNGIKCCQWFFFKHGGYWWHSKGGMWIDAHKFNPAKNQYTKDDVAIAKGVPEHCIQNLIPYNFKGVQVKVPENIGACLDEWYPGWMVPKEGASAHTYVMVVGNWKDKSTWRIG